jgi:hypothetical protein
LDELIEVLSRRILFLLGICETGSLSTLDDFWNVSERDLITGDCKNDKSRFLTPWGVEMV